MSYRALQGSPNLLRALLPAPCWQLAPGREQAVSSWAFVFSSLGKQRYFSAHSQPSGRCGCEKLFPPGSLLHGIPQPVPPGCQSAFPQILPARCLRLPGHLAGAGGGGGCPARVPSPRPPAHPALPCPEATWLSLLTLPIGSCLLGLSAALILAIPWKESFSITQLSAEPSACQLCLLTRVAGVPQQHTPAPARPGLSVPAFCTPNPHTRLPSLLGTFQPGTPNSVVSWLEWATCMYSNQLYDHPWGFPIIRSN